MQGKRDTLFNHDSARCSNLELIDLDEASTLRIDHGECEWIWRLSGGADLRRPLNEQSCIEPIDGNRGRWTTRLDASLVRRRTPIRIHAGGVGGCFTGGRQDLRNDTPTGFFRIQEEAERSRCRRHASSHSYQERSLAR